MTVEQKLNFLYKKLVNDKAFTKGDTTFFEEPISTYSQALLSYTYVNSSLIPSIAPQANIIFNSETLLTYVVDEPMISVDRAGTKFKARNGKIIPTSYGQGYGIILKSRNGTEIDSSDFPRIIDWESGEITFEETPFEIDRLNTPLISYYWYSGKTLKDVSSFSVKGPRGDVGPQGPTGPLDSSTLIYRGETAFTVSPAVNYYVNDVITFTTNGNSYICIVNTTQSPISSPSSWQLLSPAGASSQIPENVIFVYDQESVPLSNLSEGTPGYSTSLQQSLDSIDDMPKTFIVNHKSNLSSMCDDLLIEDKTVDMIFEKGALICTKPVSQDFALTIRDSEVIFKDVTIGRNIISPEARILIESVSKDTVVKFINCTINSQLLTIERSAAHNCTVIFDNCSMNMTTVDCNADLEIKGSKFSGNYLFNYDIEDVDHNLTINTSFYYSIHEYEEGPLQEINSILFNVGRGDVENCNIKFENSLLPRIGVILNPEVNTFSPINFTVDSNNCLFYFVGLDEACSYNGGSIQIIGTGNSCATFDPIQLRAFGYPDLNIVETFYAILPNDAVISIFDPNRTISYDIYKNLKIVRAKYPMISL